MMKHVLPTTSQTPCARLQSVIVPVQGVSGFVVKMLILNLNLTPRYLTMPMPQGFPQVL